MESEWTTVAGKNKTESQKLQQKHKLVEFCVSVVDFVIFFKFVFVLYDL